MTTALYLGLMSGTSKDGVDAAVVEFDGGGRLRGIRATHTVRYTAVLRARLLKLARELPPITLGEYAELDQAVAGLFAKAARGALERGGLKPRHIAAVGSHGQTVFHQPEGRVRSSIQLGDPNRIAALTGIATVADFRRRDIALGGHGAPLVPAFHHAVFARAREPRCVVNVGGIANITVLPGADTRRVFGFDTGPGNALMDEWVRTHHGRNYDANGRWAASGHLEPELLKALLGDAYFRRRPPKSTGRSHFNLDWARRRWPGLDWAPPVAVQNTFCELTARSVADAIRRFAPATRRVLICGGGVYNGFLMQRLADLLGPVPVESTDAHGLGARWVEAAAFAWLAMRTMHGLPGNMPAVTGASREAVLGGIYRA
ncbi:MAG: anhydro-N-acetylmuramic acid kinase [Gammaproteobacteria bacterium]|nr:anhydro-N-acetylmuramic acid kinase [Gammaproteobacteria bacterium]